MTVHLLWPSPVFHGLLKVVPPCDQPLQQFAVEKLAPVIQQYLEKSAGGRGWTYDITTRTNGILTLSQLFGCWVLEGAATAVITDTRPALYGSIPTEPYEIAVAPHSVLIYPANIKCEMINMDNFLPFNFSVLNIQNDN